jgi:flagellar hook-length control protein FliK
MSVTAKTTIDSTSNSIDLSYKTSKVSSSYEETYSKKFEDVLNSKSSSNDINAKKANDSNEDNSSIENTNTTKADDNHVNKTDELQDKLEKLEDDSKSDSKDKVNDILTELMSLLAKLGINKSDVTIGKVNSTELKTLIEGVNGNKTSNSVMDKLMQLLQTRSVKDSLDAGSLNSIKNILGNLSDSLNDNSSNANGIKDLIAEISNMIDNKQNQNEKVLTLQDLLNKNYSQDNKENLAKNESSNSKTSLDDKKTSKEDKFLSSLVDDNKDSSVDKINLFASRTQIVQNQGVDSTKNLTINKATLVDDLITDVKYMSNNGIKELTVKINPGNLGEITINLTQEDGVMKANLKANSKDTANLLMQNLADIKSQLSDKSIKIDDVNIELYQDDTTFFSNQGSGSQLTQEQQKNSRRIDNENGEIKTEDNLTENTEAISNENVNFLA